MVDVTEVRDGVVAAFKTERLAGRMMAEGDADYLTDLHSDAEVMATIGGVRDNLQCAVWLDANLRHWAEHGFGQWILDNDDACIGRGGLRKIDESVGEDLVEIGYVIGRSYWGNGYATEATATFIEIAFDHYGLDQLGAITLEGNDASTRVLEKCGFVFERWVDHRVGRHRFLRLVAT